MNRTLCLLINICFCFPLIAQKTGSISGTLYDTASKQPVSGATITILQKKDSALVTFSMTDNRGGFYISKLASGEYRLLVTHVKYYNLNKSVSIDEKDKEKNLGTIVMTDLHSLLQEVIVTAEDPPVTVIGDTIQYNAGSFKVQPNADVEQLLKRMPGIKVEKDGTVKAQGQEVKKVLVDGKEFFGTDPKIATKNLPADAVDKVQVYDRLSDAAQLTGFDDGNSEKTINLKLKKDKKKGLFGKATAGAGSNKRYEGRFNVNSFKGARQLSAIGTANNTNADGFSFMDLLNFTGELNRMRQGGNGNLNINLSDGNNMPAGFGNNNNTGIKTIWGGGINYNNIIGTKTDFTSNYFYNHFNPRNETDIRRQYFLPDSSYSYKQHAINDNTNNGHRLNISADIKLDSFHSIKFSPSLGYQQTSTQTNSEYQTLTQEQNTANRGYSRNFNYSEGLNFRNDLLFRKRFRQKGRTFSFNLQTSINNGEGNGRLQSVNEFFKGQNTMLRTDTINQTNDTHTELMSYNARAVFTEPILKTTLLEFSLGKSASRSKSEKLTYDYNQIAGKFNQLNPLLSNDFENLYGYTNGGFRFRRQKGKLSLATGINFQRAQLEGKIITGLKDSAMRKSFNNILPNARMQYSFSKYRTLSVNYSAITNQPTITQLQPVPDNSNPLNIRLGNPDLKQEYSHSMQVNFVSVNPFKNKNLFAFLTIQETEHKIVNYDTINNLGIKYTKPVNVNGVLNVNGNISVGLPLPFLKGLINIASNIGYYKGKQFINGAGNNISSINLSPEMRMDLRASDNLDFSVTASFTYYQTHYTLRKDLNARYFTQQYGGDINLQMASGFYFTTGFNYTINSQRNAGYNISVPLWNASLSKQFLNFNRGELKLTGFDLLNQNIGISRSTNQNYIEDSRVVNLKRYILLSFTYSLNKNGIGNNRTNGNNLRIIRN